MALLGMPMMVLNMGTEMLYILELRLHAQNIAPDRAKRVLMDVIRATFDSRFIDELLVPQHMYSASSVRGVFERLAHSSIMRLSQSSMDKLYDLMTMGFKFQLLTMRHPADLLCMTMNHIQAVKGMVSHSESAMKHVKSIEKKVVKAYTSLCTGDLVLLHASLLRFVQDKRVKVSLFLQDELQLPDGSIVLNCSGPVPNSAEIPGTIRYFSDTPISEMGALPTPFRTAPFPSLINATIGPPPRCKLGDNIYGKERKKKAESTKDAAESDSKTDASNSNANATDEANVLESPKPSEPTVGVTGLSLLANIVGDRDVKDEFQVDLFEGSGFFAQQLDGYEAVEPATAPETTIEPAVDNIFEHVRPADNNRKELNDLLTGFDDDGGGGGDGDDLLDLMDGL